MEKENFWVNDKELKCLIDAQQKLFLNYKNIAAGQEQIEVNTIPKILHFIWLGSSLPKKFEYLIEGWKILHLSWQVKLWQTEDAATFMKGRKCANQFFSSTNFGLKSDVLRYEILLAFGGVYIDVDYECIKCLDGAAWWSSCTAFAGLSHATVLEINNGILGCIPNHPLLVQITDNIASNLSILPTKQRSVLTVANMTGVWAFLDEKQCSEQRQAISNLGKHDEAMRVIASTGPGMLTRRIYDFLKDNALHTNASCRGENGSRLLILPSAVFHPVPNDISVDVGIDCYDDALRCQQNMAAMAELKAAWLRQETVAVHWWQRSWQT